MSTSKAQKAVPAANALSVIPLAEVRPSSTAAQVARRKYFVKEELTELAASIAEHGVLQPIIVRPNGKGYELVAGERRYLAAGQAGLKEIPAVVRSLTDAQVIEVQLIENLQRSDVHPMQEAEGYHELITKHGHPVEELHSRVGKSRSYVYGRMKLLDLCEKARKAFYSGELSASKALLVARIPGKKTQEEVLREIGGEGTSFRRARDLVHEHYMLRLKGAPFPRDHADVNGAAGPCTTCPKRTGNQAELFDDVKSTDVCTDPACYRTKAVAFGKIRIREAEAAGQPVIKGREAKKLMEYGRLSYNSRVVNLAEKNYSDDRCRTNRAIVGKDVVPTLLQNPETGEVMEVVPRTVVQAALDKGRKKQPRQDDGSAARKRAAKIERKFREALYERIRPALGARGIEFQVIAEVLVDLLSHEDLKALAKIRGYEPPVQKTYAGGYKDYRQIRGTVPTLSDGNDVEVMLWDMIIARELQVSTWSESKPERLLKLAAERGIDVDAVRKEVTPAPNPKGKKKKPASKRKTRSRRK